MILIRTIPPIGSVWSDDPFDSTKDVSQTVVYADEELVIYKSPSGDVIKASRNMFYDMFPYRHTEFEGEAE